MKKLTVIALSAAMLLGSAIVSRAQSKYGADSADCIKYLSYYTEYFKQKNYDEALPNWRKAYKLCPPQARQGIFVDGSTLVRRLITQTKDASYRKALVDTLITLHEIRAEHYPKYAVTALNNKGTDINNYLKGDNQAIYKGMEEVITALGNDTKATLLLFDLNAAIALYKDNQLEAEKVMEIYQRNTDLLAKIPADTDVTKEQNASIKTDMESLFVTSKVASCENILTIYTPRFEANPDNIDLATNIVKMMSSTDDCTSNDLYLKAATKMHELQPSSQSAYFLYRLNSSKGNIEEASKYMEEAISAPDLESATAATYNYEYATFCVKNGKTSQGFTAAQKAIDLDESLAGKAYYLMGTIWGSLSCSGDEISRRAPYWVACDYMNKAKNADPSLADDCNKMISQYSVYFPQTAEAFMYDLNNGDSYTVSCGGMRAVTTVRTQK